MPSIEISDEVLARIRALANSDAEPEDTILRRVLETAAEHEAKLRAYERSEKDITSTN